jgi:indole-3-acetate monooxygenase
MNHVPHPSSVLDPEWITIIRSEAQLAEQQGTLTQKQLALIYEQGWFNIFAPLGNLAPDVSLTQALLLEEALSWADGSLGWTVTLCSGAAWFGGFFSSALINEVFPDRKACLGGSGAPSGKARQTGEGYRISGRWKYATGASHLTHFTANCFIMQGDDPVLDKGEPLILPFVFKREEVTIIQDWDTIGLVATSSQSFEVKDLFVPGHRCFQIAPEALNIAHPIYNYPFLQFAEATLAVNISGVAAHFVDCCHDVFSRRIGGGKLKDTQAAFLTETLKASGQQLADARAFFYRLMETSWQHVVKDTVMPQPIFNDISLASRKLASVSHQVVNGLYPLCGLLAANPNSEINRVWRDIHTASQHSLLTLP